MLIVVLVVLAFVIMPASTTATSTNGRSPAWPQMKETTLSEPITMVGGILQSVSTKMNYVDPSCGLISIRRDTSGSDNGLEGAIWVPTETKIHNGRLDPSISLEQSGFECVSRKIAEDDVDFYNQSDVLSRYYPHCEKVLRERLGGKVHVRAFDHNVRSTGSRRTLEGASNDASVQNPAGIVHADYTSVSAPRRLEQLSLPPKKNDVRSEPILAEGVVEKCLAGKRRYALINVWRNIDKESPVKQIPLACIDARSVGSADDLRTFQIHYVDRVGENYFTAHSKAHRWFYFPEMTHDEAILLKQWDSNGDYAAPASLFSIHSAFLDPSSPSDAPPRQSIEVRCVAIWDEDQ